jgi:glycosyltransferase involved in cell wall biosynthesis
MRLLVLYEELAGYFISSIAHFAQTTKIDVVIMHKSSNVVAPFKLESSTYIQLKNRDEISEQELYQFVNTLQPNYLFCGGWAHKPYLKICKSFKGNIPIVVGFDNQWIGNLKQQLAALYAKVYFKKLFDKAFVPGGLQKKFAQKIGFKEKDILLGAYCCDYQLFSNLYTDTQKKKHENFPKVFLYTGRYSQEKGITDLWNAFVELEDHKNWELWCVGVGVIPPIKHPKIKHFGFVQPKELAPIIEKSGVFILPSHFEPWGVVVHEYTAAGFPVLCSTKVGASEVFLEDNVNGYSFTPGNKNEIKNVLNKVIQMDETKLIEMSQKSHQISQKITNDSWTNSLKQLFGIK